jgi:regulator of ribonuclease activity B
MTRSVALVNIALATVSCAPAAARGEGPVAYDRTDAMDRDAIAQLKRNGSDVTKPTDVVHYLYISARRDAEEASRRSAAAGYRSAVEAPLGNLPNGTVENRYSVIAHKTIVPSLGNVRRARTFFESLAHRFGGEYDGWEAAVVK